MSAFDEKGVEEAALGYFTKLGYQVLHGPDVAPGALVSEQETYEEVILWCRLREAIRRINPGATSTVIEEAIKIVNRAESQSPIEENYRLHRLITEGVSV